MDLNKLSDKDLALLLEELESEDEALCNDVAKIEQSIERDEALDFVDLTGDDDSNIEDLTDELNKYKGSPISDIKLKKLPESKTKYKIRIQRMAINQNIIKLSENIPNYDLQALIRVIAEKQVLISERANESANKRLRRLLNSLIPIQIRRLYNMYPWTVKRCPGFTYSTIYTGRVRGLSGMPISTGNKLDFWATPDIPYFFKQGTEQNVLMAYRPEMTYLVDNAINMYHKYQNAQETKALGVASRIIKNKVTTYFDLLMYNPRWFEIIYNIASNAETTNNGTPRTI